MQINKIDNSQTTFKSKFIPNKYLESAFDNAYSTANRGFMKSVKAILNDGKEDTIELTKGSNSNLNLFVNKELKEESIIFSYYGNPAIHVIQKYAQELAGINIFEKAFYDLSNKEKEIISEDVDVIKMLSENFKHSKNYIEDVQKIIQNIKQKINDNTKQELLELKEIIFKNNN